MAPYDPRDTDALQYDNEFWRFSLAVYGQDDVAQECLQLQQVGGIDINLLLFCAWLGTRAIVLSAVEIDLPCQIVGLTMHITSYGCDGSMTRQPPECAIR